MINNSININKTNIHLSTQIIYILIPKRFMAFADGNPGPGLGRAYKCGGLNQLKGSKPFSLDK